MYWDSEIWNCEFHEIGRENWSRPGFRIAKGKIRSWRHSWPRLFWRGCRPEIWRGYRRNIWGIDTIPNKCRGLWNGPRRIWSNGEHDGWKGESTSFSIWM